MTENVLCTLVQSQSSKHVCRILFLMRTSKDIQRCLKKSRTPSLRLQYNLQTVFTVHCQLSRCPKICALPAEHYVNYHTLERETFPTVLKKLFRTFSYAAFMDLMSKAIWSNYTPIDWLSVPAEVGWHYINHFIM